MNKLTKLLITISILLSTLGSHPVFLDVYAANVPSTNLITACGPNKYSVDKIIGYDNFQNVACYSETEFSLAYNKMLEIAPNSVIRHDSSDSPLNIVAADRAVAYSMNFTYLEQDTLNLYSDKDLSTYYTYINQSNTLYYYDTYIIGNATTVKPENLSVLIEINGAKGYVRLKGVDIIPMIYVENRVDLTKDDLYNNTLNVGNSWYVAYQTRNSDGSFKSDAIRPNISYYIVAPLSNKLIPKSPSCPFSNGDLVLYTDTATGSFCRSVGKAPSWLTAGKYYSKNGIDFYYDMDLTNPVLNNGVEGKHYNYFSYLPLRSKTNYTAIELNNYLKSILNTADQEKSVIFGNEQFFIDAQNIYGMNALLILALGIQESDYGRSTYAQLPANIKTGTLVKNPTTLEIVQIKDSSSGNFRNMTVKEYCTLDNKNTYIDEFGSLRYCLGRNNIFGYGAVDSDPNNAAAFISLEAGINEHMGINLRYYLDAMNSNQYSSSIGNKGVGINTRYASDPWWSVKIASIAYQIDRYLGLKDYDNYQLGILKNDVNRDFYSDASLATKLYSINSQASTYTVVLKEQVGDKYKTQASNPIDSSNNIIISLPGSHLKPVNWSPSLAYKPSNVKEIYNWDTSVEYKTISSFNLINTSKNPIGVSTGTDNLIIYTSKLEWNDNSLIVKGYAALRNTNMNNDQTKHILKFTDMKDNSNTYEFNLNLSTPEFPINFLNGYDYSKAWFEGNIDISNIVPGYYKIEVNTSTNGVNSISELSNTDRTAPKPLTKKIGDSNYKFIFNNTAKMRYELYIEKGLDYVLQNKQHISRFYPIAFLDSFSIVDGVFTFEGIAYQIGNVTNQASSVDQKLILLSMDGTQTVYELNESTGKYNYSNGGNDYSFAWFNNIVDLTTLPIGEYKLFIINSSNNNIDSIEIRDYLKFGMYESSYNGRKYSLIADSVLKDRLTLKIE